MRYNPDYISPPGDTLKDKLDEIGLKQSDLARATGYTPKHINQVIKAGKPVSVDFAIALEKELGIPARFWLHRQVDYDLKMKQRKDNNK